MSSNGISSHILPTSATMVGVCMTVISIGKIAHGHAGVIIDRTLAVDSALFLLRAPNIMKHVCVAVKIGADAKGGAEHIANMVKPTDKVSAGFGCNPLGWHDFWPMALSLPLPIFAILAAGHFAP